MASADSEVRPGPRLLTLRAHRTKIGEAGPEALHTLSLPILSFRRLALAHPAPRAERPLPAHTFGALRSHRSYLSADMGTKVMSAAARWLLFLSVWARKTATDGSKVLDRF